MRTLLRSQRKPANLLWHVLGGGCRTCQHPLAGFEIDDTAVPRFCHAVLLVARRFVCSFATVKRMYKLNIKECLVLEKVNAVVSTFSRTRHRLFRLLLSVYFFLFQYFSSILASFLVMWMMAPCFCSAKLVRVILPSPKLPSGV